MRPNRLTSRRIIGRKTLSPFFDVRTFTQAYTWRELVALYGLTQPAMNLQPRYNIGPTATIDVLIPRNSDQLALWQMGWGLIPSWWTKTRKELPSTFNARFRKASRNIGLLVIVSARRIPRSGPPATRSRVTVLERFEM